MTREEVIQQVQALYRLAENRAATPGESRAALDAVQRLMDKWHLQAADVREDDQPAAPKLQEQTVSQSHGQCVWIRTLAGGVATLMGCVVVHGWRGFSFVGYGGDAQIAQALFRVLAAHGKRRAEEERKRCRNKFLIGFGRGVTAQVAEHFRRPAATINNCVAIIVASKRDRAMQQYMAEHPDAKPRERDTPISRVSQAMWRGFVTGKHADLGHRTKLETTAAVAAAN